VRVAGGGGGGGGAAPPAKGFLHHLGEIQSAQERSLGAAADDGGGDAAGFALLAIEPDQAGEFALSLLIDEFSGARAIDAHAHVEGPVAHEGKTALGFVQLHGGDAKIEDDSVHGRFADTGEPSLKLGKAAGDQTEVLGMVIYERGGEARGDGVAVEGDHLCAADKERAGVAASAKGGVDQHRAGHGRHRFDHFV
jgi:hypothetical protein